MTDLVFTRNKRTDLRKAFFNEEVIAVFGNVKLLLDLDILIKTGLENLDKYLVIFVDGAISAEFENIEQCKDYIKSFFYKEV